MEGAALVLFGEDAGVAQATSQAPQASAGRPLPEGSSAEACGGPAASFESIALSSRRNARACRQYPARS